MKKNNLLGMVLLCGVCLLGCSNTIEMNTGEKIHFSINSEEINSLDTYGKIEVGINNDEINNQFINKLTDEFVKDYMKENNLSFLIMTITSYKIGGDSPKEIIYEYHKATDEISYSIY